MLTDTLNAPSVPLVEDDENHADGTAAEVDPSAASRQADTVLIVDDEEILRAVCSEMFRELGFEVLTANGGVEALQIFREQGGRIILVLLDYSMPGMDGVALFRELRKGGPHVPVLLASGYGEAEVAVRFKGLDLNGYIQKPFNMNRLGDEVRRVLKSEVKGEG